MRNKRSLDDLIRTGRHPKYLKYLVPHNITGFAMLLMAGWSMFRQDSVVSATLTSWTFGIVTAPIAAVFLIVPALILIFKRPRPNAFHYFILSIPVLFYTAIFMYIAFNSPTASGIGAVMSLGFWGYGLVHILWMDEFDL